METGLVLRFSLTYVELYNVVLLVGETELAFYLSSANAGKVCVIFTFHR